MRVIYEKCEVISAVVKEFSHPGIMVILLVYNKCWEYWDETSQTLRESQKHGNDYELLSIHDRWWRLEWSERSKVKTVLVSCLVLSVNSPWCRSSWQSWPSGRGSRQQPKAWTSWPPSPWPRSKRPAESRKTPKCWWDVTSFTSRSHEEWRARTSNERQISCI